MNGVPAMWPSLVSREPRVMIDFLVRALGFTERATYTEHGDVVHSELVWAGPDGAGAGVMVGPTAGDCDRPPGGAAIHLVAEDIDDRFRRAVDAGATVVREPWWADYGSHLFEVRDPEGNLWSVGTWHE